MSIPFILTSFIQELPEPIILSESLGFCFDNPRTEREVEGISERLKSFSTHKFWKIVLNQEVALTQDELLKSTKHWVICRHNFDFTGIIKPKLEEMGDFMDSALFADYSQKEDLLSGYSALVSLMTLQKMERKNIRTYLLNSYNADIDFLDFLNSSVLSSLSDLLPIEQRETIFPKFSEFYTAAKPILKKLEQFLDGKDEEKNKYKEKILYIGEILNNVFDLADEKMKLVSLVGILELLLTHNPDVQRFNVEDSITKQFKLKMAVIIYQNEKKCDLEKTKKN